MSIVCLFSILTANGDTDQEGKQRSNQLCLNNPNSFTRNASESHFGHRLQLREGRVLGS